MAAWGRLASVPVGYLKPSFGWGSSNSLGKISTHFRLLVAFEIILRTFTLFISLLFGLMERKHSVADLGVSGEGGFKNGCNPNVLIRSHSPLSPVNCLLKRRCQLICKIPLSNFYLHWSFQKLIVLQSAKGFKSPSSVCAEI